jgi:NAD(P)-dependent dehydrogenase (short-subunit alcohol dehydrogenase family)
MDLKNRSCIITGGGTGIGAAVASKLCDEGARVLIVGRRENKLRHTAEALRSRGGMINYRPTDISDAEECKEVVREAKNMYGTVDILVNNAGIVCHGRTIEEHTVEEWDRVMAVNLRAAFLLTCEVLPIMKSNQSGCIIMVSSDSGVHYFQNQVIYGLSKHGMNDLVQYVLSEYSQYNIHAVSLCPGLTDTEMGLGLNPTVRENVLSKENIAEWAIWVMKQPDNLKIAGPIILSPMRDPWE